MIDTIIISGGNIQNGFALDFLKKRIEESRGEKITLVAADKGMEWFMKTGNLFRILQLGILTVFPKKAKNIWKA